MRKPRNIYALCAGICLLLGMLCMTVQAEAAAARPKTVALNALLDMVKLNKGKVVVLNFFATWCPPCKEEIPGLVALAKAYPASKVAIIGVSVDQDPAAIAGFTQGLHVNYPVFHAGNDITEAFNVRTIPHNVIYDTTGQMAANVTGLVTEADLKEFITILLEKKKK